jgi:hypothetical protein
MSEDFMLLLEAKEPAALVIMSYACVLSDDDVGESFVMQGWKDSVCSEIRNIVGPRWADVVAD